MNLTPEQRAFFDRLDEMPQQRGGGFIVGIGRPAEFRSKRKPRFPRLERCQRQLAELESDMDRRSAWLEITGRLLEMEDRL